MTMINLYYINHPLPSIVLLSYVMYKERKKEIHHYMYRQQQ